MKIEINLWELLGKNKLTIKALSELTGISRQQLHNIKHWKTNKISFEVIEKLLKGLKCEPNDLFKIIK